MYVNTYPVFYLINRNDYGFSPSNYSGSAFDVYDDGSLGSNDGLNWDSCGNILYQEINIFALRGFIRTTMARTM